MAQLWVVSPVFISETLNQDHMSMTLLDPSIISNHCIIFSFEPGHVSYGICEQQRCRLACASAQSDQHLCCLLLRQYDIYTCSIKSFTILASFVAEQAGLNLTWSKIPKDTFLPDIALLWIAWTTVVKPSDTCHYCGLRTLTGIVIKWQSGAQLYTVVAFFPVLQCLPMHKIAEDKWSSGTCPQERSSLVSTNLPQHLQ